MKTLPKKTQGMYDRRSNSKPHAHTETETDGRLPPRQPQRSSSITELCLGHNSITDAGLTEMARHAQAGPLGSIIDLDLTRNNFTGIGARALCHAVNDHIKIRCLVLDRNALSEAESDLQQRAQAGVDLAHY